MQCDYGEGLRDEQWQQPQPVEYRTGVEEEAYMYADPPPYSSNMDEDIQGDITSLALALVPQGSQQSPRDESSGTGEEEETRQWAEEWNRQWQQTGSQIDELVTHVRDLVSMTPR